MRYSTHLLAISSLVLLLAAGPASAAGQLTVLLSGGFSLPYHDVITEFEHDTGIKVTTLSAASQGTGPKTIKAQLESGADADVVILNKEGLGALVAAGRIVDGSERELAITHLAAAVRQGSPKPDISTVDGLRDALLKAHLVAMPNNASGMFVRDEVLSKLGVVGKVSLKFVPRGEDSTRMLAAGEADLSIGPESELVSQPGVEPIGPLPKEVQLKRVFAAAIVNTGHHAAEAKQLIEFLGSERAFAAIKKAALEPAGDHVGH